MKLIFITTALLLCPFFANSSDARRSSQAVEALEDAADEGDGDIESGVYNNRENENLLIVSQSLRSRIEELREQNRKLGEDIHAEKLRMKSLQQEGGVLEARSRNRAETKRANAEARSGLKPVRRVTETVEELGRQ